MTVKTGGGSRQSKLGIVAARSCAQRHDAGGTHCGRIWKSSGSWRRRLAQCRRTDRHLRDDDERATCPILALGVHAGWLANQIEQIEERLQHGENS